jgi:hypothetical protein
VRPPPEWLDWLRAEIDALRVRADAEKAAAKREALGLAPMLDALRARVDRDQEPAIVAPIDPELRAAAMLDAMHESRDAHERESDRAKAAWVTGSPYHAREADRAREWAEFHALACRGRH